MKIWFDISNSPHVNMFYDLIKELEADGHEIIITSRPLANTIELLEQKKLKHTIIGAHYGKNIFRKIAGYPIRVIQLIKFLSPIQPDLAISQSSFHSPIVAKWLKIPSIYTNDNEHAMGNKPSFYFATKILIPENLSLEKIKGLGISANKITQYPGLKEGIYLWKKSKKILADRLDNLTSVKTIYIRPEPRTAQYYNGETNFLDETILALQKQYNVTILPRDEHQKRHYQQDQFKYSWVPNRPLNFEQIAADCSVFVGAGGSMTREMAMLGIPTISVYNDSLLDVDKYLITNGMMQYEKDISAGKIIQLIENSSSQSPSHQLMQKGEAAYQLFKNEILKTYTNDKNSRYRNRKNGYLSFSHHSSPSSR